MKTILTKKILFSVVLCSTLVTFFVVIFHLYLDYNNQIAKTKDDISNLIFLNKSSLEQSLWDLNNSQTESILKGYISHKKVDYLELIFESIEGKKVKKYGIIPLNSVKKNINLTYEGKTIGELHFHSSKSRVYSHLWSNLFNTILTNMIKTFMTSILIFYLVSFLVTKKVLKMVDYIQKEDFEHPLKLKKTLNKKDELDDLVNSLNGYIVMAINQKKSLEKLVQERTKELEKASNTKTLFLANMSHEIRTPLNGIIGCSEILKDTIHNEEEKLLLDTISESGKSLITLVNDILDISKIDSKKMKFEKIPFNLKKDLDNIIVLMTPKAREKNNKVILNYETDKMFFIGDPYRLKQVFINIIGNALKFTKEGEVKIHVDYQKSIIVKIIDNGIGMKEETLKNIFKEFDQGDSSTTRKFGGTGLGLSISKKIIANMKGKIEVESKYEVGSTFIITIPLKESSPINEIKNASEFNRSLKILVAEDNNINKMVIKKLLTNLGHSVEIASDGIECLEMFKKEEYDLILMDYQMPRLDGAMTTEKIREEDDKIIILGLTASVIQEEIDRCLKSGMNDVLSKPILVDTLNEKFRFYFQKS